MVRTFGPFPNDKGIFDSSAKATYRGFVPFRRFDYSAALVGREANLDIHSSDFLVRGITWGIERSVLIGPELMGGAPLLLEDPRCTQLNAQYPGDSPHIKGYLKLTGTKGDFYRFNTDIIIETRRTFSGYWSAESSGTDGKDENTVAYRLNTHSEIEFPKDRSVEALVPLICKFCAEEKFLQD